MDDLKLARTLLEEGATCALCKGETVYTSRARGIQPMVHFLEQAVPLQGFSAADKVVGKAAALLFVRSGVRAVYAPVMSRQALTILSRNGIQADYDIITEAILNRQGNGLCPMEAAVQGIEEPEAAFTAVRETLRILKEKEAVQ